jgi:fatty acid desaturase
MSYVKVFQSAKKRGEENLVYSEVSIMIITYFMFYLASPKGFFLQLIPFIILGQVLSLLENYAEHDRASLGDRKRNSVSCYNKIYNFLWFNNGHHQEHHFKPSVHWSKIDAVTLSLPLQNSRRVVRGAHIFGFFQ